LLDGDQIIVFDPSKIYLVDDSVTEPLSIKSKVQRKSDGMIGVIVAKDLIPPGQYERQKQFWDTVPMDDPRRQKYSVMTPDTKYRLHVKWQKGGTDFNVYDTDVVPYEGKKSLRVR
jgi:hypothetical protein